MLIVLHGEDTFRSLRALEGIKEKFKREVDPSGSSISVINGEDGDALDLLQSALFAPSFFARRRLVVLKNALKAAPSFQKVLTDILIKDSSGGEHIIACWEDHKIGAKAKARSAKRPAKTKKPPKESDKKLEQIFLDSPYAKHYGELAGKELIQWIAAECGSQDAVIEDAALRELAERIGSDLWRMNNELRKLSALTQKSITFKTVAQNVSRLSEQNIFEVLDNIIKGNIHSSLRSAADLLDKGMSFQEFFAVLTGQFRNIWELKSGMSRPELHSFARKKALELSGRFSDGKIKEILNVLVAIDGELKTTGASGRLLLDRLIVKIAEIVKTTS